MITVDEHTVVEVGKYYRVRCAEMKSTSSEYKMYVPIIGQLHRDPQFGKGGELPHYHVDGRFAREGCSYNHYEVDGMGRTNVVVPNNYDANYLYHFTGKIVQKKIKCKRTTTGLIPPIVGWKGEETTWVKWYKDQIGKSCAGKRCPHLGHAMHEVNGRLVCPLHNLQGCKETEVIIPAIEFTNQ